MRYRTIVADPPWEKPDTGARTIPPGGGSWAPFAGTVNATPYEQMTLDEIAALPIPDLAEDDAHLYVWTFGPYIPEAYRLVAEWGFTVRMTPRTTRLTATAAAVVLGVGA